MYKLVVAFSCRISNCIDYGVLKFCILWKEYKNIYITPYKVQTYDYFCFAFTFKIMNFRF